MNYLRYLVHSSSSLSVWCLAWLWPALAELHVPFPGGTLCCLAPLNGINILQFISLFVMSSLLAFSVCLTQLLGFKMKWLIKQISPVPFTQRRQTFGSLCSLFYPSFFSLMCSPFSPETKREAGKWNMNVFRKAREKFKNLSLEVN